MHAHYDDDTTERLSCPSCGLPLDWCPYCNECCCHCTCWLVGAQVDYIPAVDPDYELWSDEYRQGLRGQRITTVVTIPGYLRDEDTLEVSRPQRRERTTLCQPLGSAI